MTPKTSKQKQHVDYHRKVGLRKRLLSGVTGKQPVYVPFIGDGDIAHDLYQHMSVYGADIDQARVETACKRLPNATVIRADCNSFPFPDVGPFSVADFDAYSDPYEAFRSFWNTAKKSNRLVLFFTDGHRQGIMRTGHVVFPDGHKEFHQAINERRRLFNFYFPQVVFPWFVYYILPYSVLTKSFYLRGMMLYWGVVIHRAD